MRRYWWVNHKKTFKDELEGGYLWSPKVEASGARSQFYDNMRVARPGDAVISYADGQIKALGTVSDLAIAAPKPREFGLRGANWAGNGWLVPVAWRRLVAPVKPKDFFDRLLPLLPPKYSPLQRATGNGSQKAYLAEVSNEVFNLIQDRSSEYHLSVPPDDFNGISARNFVEGIDSAVEANIRDDNSLAETEKAQLILARRGQGVFRYSVSLIEKCCRCTSITEPELLIASHIKPWRCCDSAEERLDGSNGLLLSPNADLLFDRGFIAFENNGKLVVSSALRDETLKKLGISGAPARPFSSLQQRYLQYHRANIFLG